MDKKNKPPVWVWVDEGTAVWEQQPPALVAPKRKAAALDSCGPDAGDDE